jgi:hypothetical protein
LTEGSNITITVNSETNQIEITSTAEKGYSPTAKVEENLTGATITITDETGTTTAEVYNGKDGLSPTASVSQTESGATITVVSGEETTSANLSNGMTPHIGENKNWYVGDKDTGVLAEGTTTVTTTAVVYTGMLIADDWIGDVAPYTQTVNITGIDETARPILYPTLSDDVSTGLEEQKQWGYITRAVTNTDTITFSCYKTKPTININFEAEVR